MIVGIYAYYVSIKIYVIFGGINNGAIASGGKLDTYIWCNICILSCL